MPRVARLKPPCIECGKPCRKLLRCETCAKRWTRQHAGDRCTLCGAQTADPAGGQRRGRKWTTRNGVVITCRSCLPTFLEGRRPKLLEALAAIVEPDPRTDAWLAKTATRNASGYGQLRVPGTKQKVYAHHAAYALFHGAWTAGEQIHHRTQDAAEVSPWTLEAVPVAEHEQRKQLPPDRMPVNVPRLEELREFADAHDLPLSWGLHKRAGSISPKPTKESAVVVDLAIYRKYRGQQPPAVPPRFIAPSNRAIFDALDRHHRREGEEVRAQLHYLRTGTTA